MHVTNAMMKTVKLYFNNVVTDQLFQGNTDNGFGVYVEVFIVTPACVTSCVMFSFHKKIVCFCLSTTACGITSHVCLCVLTIPTEFLQVVGASRQL